MRVFYTKPTTRQQEASFFQGFLERYPEFNAYDYLHLDNPDFQGTHENKRIGIEVISLVNDCIIEIRKVKEKALAQLADIAAQAGLPPTWVRISWKDSTTWCNKAELVKELKTKVLPLLSLPRDGHRSRSFDMAEDCTFMSEVMCTPIHDGHRWETLPRNWVRRVLEADIQAILEKKHKKLADYLTKVEECWLLIGVDDWNPDQAYGLSPEARQATYMTAFKRVFFLRNGESKVDELTTTMLRSKY